MCEYFGWHPSIHAWKTNKSWVTGVLQQLLGIYYAFYQGKESRNENKKTQRKSDRQFILLHFAYDYRTDQSLVRWNDNNVVDICSNAVGVNLVFRRHDTYPCQYSVPV